MFRLIRAKPSSNHMGWSAYPCWIPSQRGEPSVVGTTEFNLGERRSACSRRCTCCDLLPRGVVPSASKCSQNRSSSFAIHSFTNLPTNSKRRANNVRGNNFMDTHDIQWAFLNLGLGVHVYYCSYTAAVLNNLNVVNANANCPLLPEVRAESVARLPNWYMASGNVPGHGPVSRQQFSKFSNRKLSHPVGVSSRCFKTPSK